MRKPFIVLFLGAMLVVSLIVSACGNSSSPAYKPTNATQQPASSQNTTQPSNTSTTPATGQTPEPTANGIPTPDNWVTVTIHTTEGGYVRFDPYTLYISATDVAGILWVNNTDLTLTVLNSDIPSTVSPSSLTFAPHQSLKLTLPQNETGQYLFHINENGDVMPMDQHCTIIRE